MALQFGPKNSQNISGEYALFTSFGKTVYETYYGGAATVMFRLSTDQLSNIGSAVTVDSTSGNTGPPLNDPISYDVVTGRLHLIYCRNENSGANNPAIYHKYSDNNGTSWSTEHTIDDGSTHSTQEFVRAAIYANNGNVTVWSTFINNSTFLTDGLYRNISSDGGATWGGQTQPYSSFAVQPSEPNIHGDGQYVIASWYDSLSGAGGAGNLYCSLSSDSGATWSSSAKLVANGSFGRPRPTILNGYCMIVANSNWGGSIADVSTVRSTDLGNTWAAPVVQATHGTGPLDHPDIRMIGEQVHIYWVDQSNSPITYGAKISTDKGVSFGSTIVPMTQTGTSDAPLLIATDDYMIFKGGDNTANTTIWTRYPAFAALPGSIATADDFNRANESPLSGGGNWTTKSGDTNQLKLVSNAVRRTVASGTFSRDGSRYTVTTVGANNPIAVKATVSGISSDTTTGDVNIIIWNESGASGYTLGYASDGTLNLNGTVAGFITQFNMGGTSAGDQLEFQIDADDLVCWYTRSGDTFEAIRWPNIDTRVAFQGVLEISDQNDTPNVWQMDDFGIAQLVVPSNSVAPSITGSLGGTLSVVSNGTWATANGATPYRWTYQWQTSPTGSSWSDVSGATLWYYQSVNSSLYHRVMVTGTNTIGSTSVASDPIRPVFAIPPISQVVMRGRW